MKKNSGFKVLVNGLCEGRSPGGIVCVAEEHLSPKLLSDSAWIVACSK